MLIIVTFICRFQCFTLYPSDYCLHGIVCVPTESWIFVDHHHCITEVVQEYATFTMIILRIHWPTLTFIRCWWYYNRLQYLKLCASSLFFSSLSWRLGAPEEMDWLSSAMILSRIQCAPCSWMYCRTFLRLKRLGFEISSKDYSHAVVQGIPKFF